MDWWLDEHTTAGAEHLDAGYVAGYDAKAQFDPGEDIAILRSHGLGPASTVVDLGAGTGTFARAAAEAGATVTAVDISPTMIDAMERRAATSDVEIVQAGFLSYRHGGDPVDFVYSRNALHQLPDFWKVVALRQVRRLLRPGGILRLRDLVFDLEPDDIESAIEAWLSRAVDDPAQGYTAADLAEHVRSEHSTFTWLLEPMLGHAGFEIIERETRRSVYAAYTCRASGDDPDGDADPDDDAIAARIER